MLVKIRDYLIDLRNQQRIAISLGKGLAAMQSRKVDLTRPGTWEFSGFSQNGEDGILDVLRQNLRQTNRYFIEIGAAEGIENNSAWLIMAHKYNGLMIDGSPRRVREANRGTVLYSIGVTCRQLFVRNDNVEELLKSNPPKDLDIFSLDIDGNDYYIAQRVFALGFRPKIFVVEYNSSYGPERSQTIPYQPDFFFKTAHATHLYYGVSIAAWRKFFAERGYRFITVDRNGVNGFFVDPAHFEPAFLEGVRGLDFAENQYKYLKFAGGHTIQRELIKDMPFVDV
jgi:hypothetical protein